MMPSSTNLLQRALSLLLLLSASQVTDSKRVVAFKFLEGSGTCNSGDLWDVDMGEFHVDCGNANHGCTPGNSIMIYGDFSTDEYFDTVADVDIKACEFGSLICTPNFIETDFNVCYDLNLWDTEGYETCNEAGNYTFEASYILPNNHSWWQDVAFEGLKFNIVVTIDQDMECRGTFVTRIYYEYEAWMSVVVVSSLALATGLYYYIRKKQEEKSQVKINVSVEDEGDEAQQKSKQKDQILVKKMPKGLKTTPSISAVRTASADDESVTSTAYLRMLDFSPEGLSHADRMEHVRQAHFERLRRSRDSRRAVSPVTSKV